MSGPDLVEAYAIGAAIAFQVFLSWYLLGAELAIIFGVATVLGIVLNRTPLNKPRRVVSRKISRPSEYLPSKSLSAGVTARKKKNVIVIPDSPVLSQPLPKKSSRNSAARNLSSNFAKEL